MTTPSCSDSTLSVATGMWMISSHLTEKTVRRTISKTTLAIGRRNASRNSIKNLI